MKDERVRVGRWKGGNMDGQKKRVEMKTKKKKRVEE